MKSLFDAAYSCIRIEDADTKVNETRALYQYWQSDSLSIEPDVEPKEIVLPGQPPGLKLVPPRELTRRSVHTENGRIALLHAIAHIEFNAINLALDAVYRFRGLPRQYYSDWLKVADEEAYHFSLLNKYLTDESYEYGDFVAHNGLWEMALRTSQDVLIRMALVPRVMEARGLDVTPGIIEKFASIKDDRAINILKTILKDEVGHVEIGTRWFHYFCEQRGLPNQETFEKLMSQYMIGRVRLPLHHEARKAAGFSDKELEYLEGLA